MLCFKSFLLSKSFLSTVERRENKQTTSSLCDIFIRGFLRLPELMFMKLSNKCQPFWKKRKKKTFLESIGNIFKKDYTACFSTLKKLYSFHSKPVSLFYSKGPVSFMFAYE